MLTYIPRLQKYRVILIQICRESTKDSSASFMDINLLECGRIVMLYYRCQTKKLQNTIYRKRAFPWIRFLSSITKRYSHAPKILTNLPGDRKSWRVGQEIQPFSWCVQLSFLKTCYMLIQLAMEAVLQADVCNSVKLGTDLYKYKITF